jgi:hypothetical protein
MRSPNHFLPRACLAAACLSLFAAGLNGVIVEGLKGSRIPVILASATDASLSRQNPKGFPEIESLYLEGGSFKLAPDKKRMIAVKPTSLEGELQGKKEAHVQAEEGGDGE